MSRQQVVNELHKQARKNFVRRRVIIKGIDDLWQADIVEMCVYANMNKMYRYMLTVIDTFSKFAWVVPLKSKTAKEVTAAMSYIFNQGRLPKNLQTDNGKEFYNNQFSSLMQRHNINHYSTFSTLKASIIERFNRTLKGMMWKQFSLQGNYKWIHLYQDLVDMYNSKKHRTIGIQPREVSQDNEKEILQNKFNHRKVFLRGKFKIGDFVRISKYKHIFSKGYTPNWTTEIFKISKVQNTFPVTYLLEDYQGNHIKGGFYENELQETRFPDIFLVEKVLKTSGNRAFVKWLGFSSQHNSWINKKEIL